MYKTLFLPLKKEWYEMIESGVKTEEYREIKPYWIKRLLEIIDVHHTHYENIDDECAWFYANRVELMKTDYGLGGFRVKSYKCVTFSYGYTKRTMTFQLEGISIGRGRKDWGAPKEDVFIIHLGRKL